MSSYNKAILLGNLTRDPELRHTQGGTAICKFGLALNRKYKNAEGEWVEAVDFVDVTCFGKRGEAFAKYHSKGDAAFVEGSLRFDQWEDKESGAKRSKLYVLADNWEFVGGGKKQSRASEPDGWQPSEAVAGSVTPESLEADDGGTPF